MDEINVDAMRERRRMRAALESMKRKRSSAVTGFVLALGLVVMAERYSEFPEAIRWCMRLAAPLILLPTALPFFRAACPRCKGRYHTVGNLLRHPDRAPPCKSCGFDIDLHISMY